ncbi:MAG: hemolysin-related protein with domain [Chitinophagaceae bacterium]|nr:hemolysin-related protein with domain [Chitinophagaceae bacterium]
MDSSSRSPLLKKISSLFTSKKAQPSEDSAHRVQEELEAASGKPSSADEVWLVKKLLNFSRATARQVMRSRMEMVALDLDSSFTEVKEIITTTNFSRYPVYRESIDKVEGILNIKDLLIHFSKGNEFVWQQLVRPCEYIPENKKIDELLKDFQLKRNHIAIVVDEYGGTAGLVTLEDIIEEIVGEIRDEYDEEEQAFIRTGQNTYLFEAKTSITDFCNAVGVDPSTFDEVKGDSESLGGLVMSINQDLPEKGALIPYKGFIFKIEEANDKRIERITVELKETASHDEE